MAKELRFIVRDPERLKAAREALTFTQADMADMIGLSRDGYTKVELGKQGVAGQIAKLICAISNTELGDIFKTNRDDIKFANQER